jgi:hypothetical protein
VGDTEEYVRIQWGLANEIDRHSYSDRTSEWWSWCTDGNWVWGTLVDCYEYGASVNFVDGKVYSIHE